VHELALMRHGVSAELDWRRVLWAPFLP